jgi:hypothetical protein
MKKLAVLVSLVVATPVFACPHEDAAAPKTAEKAKEPAKEAPAKDAPAPAKEQKKDEAKPAETAKAKEQPKKEEPKKPTKVSQK